jgi:hypothetical protein
LTVEQLAFGIITHAKRRFRWEDISILFTHTPSGDILTGNLPIPLKSLGFNRERAAQKYLTVTWKVVIAAISQELHLWQTSAL